MSGQPTTYNVTTTALPTDDLAAIRRAVEYLAAAEARRRSDAGHPAILN